MSIKAPRCKLCRREGEKLFLKGDRCATQKCSVVKRNFPPGKDGTIRKTRISEYGRELRAKQKAKRIYGLRERQFKKYFSQALKFKGITGDYLIGLLETRLDNVIYRLGWAKSRSLARQLVSHGHVMLNGGRVDISSCQVRINDQISLRENDLKKTYFKTLATSSKQASVPTWLSSENKENNFKAKIIAKPTMKDVDQSIDTQLIVEFYSR